MNRSCLHGLSAWDWVLLEEVVGAGEEVAVEEAPNSVPEITETTLVIPPTKYREVPKEEEVEDLVEEAVVAWFTPPLQLRVHQCRHTEVAEAEVGVERTVVGVDSVTTRLGRKLPHTAIDLKPTSYLIS
jgi:hypothetical protein